jgi:hypothetical protein
VARKGFEPRVAHGPGELHEAQARLAVGGERRRSAHVLRDRREQRLRRDRIRAVEREAVELDPRQVVADLESRALEPGDAADDPSRIDDGEHERAVVLRPQDGAARRQRFERDAVGPRHHAVQRARADQALLRGRGGRRSFRLRGARSERARESLRNGNAQADRQSDAHDPGGTGETHRSLLGFFCAE